MTKERSGAHWKDLPVPAPSLHDLRLEFELHRDILERSLGRGGAPLNIERARREATETLHALLVLSAELRETVAPK